MMVSFRFKVRQYFFWGIEQRQKKQPCQNVPAAGNFAAYSQIFAAYLMLEFTYAD